MITTIFLPWHASTFRNLCVVLRWAQLFWSGQNWFSLSSRCTIEHRICSYPVHMVIPVQSLLRVNQNTSFDWLITLSTEVLKCFYIPLLKFKVNYRILNRHSQKIIKSAGSITKKETERKTKWLLQTYANERGNASTGHAKERTLFWLRTNSSILLYHFFTVSATGTGPRCLSSLGRLIIWYPFRGTKLLTCEGKVLIWMFGGIKVNKNWRKRYSKETSYSIVIT
jgi:hypothetical protein